jgi:aldehyde dehydrogenase (NAD(P)+)
MEVELTAPNGRTWTQPLGLFINNEFVKSSTGEVIATINPTSVPSAVSVAQPSSAHG